jgi:hypothetical protein
MEIYRNETAVIKLTVPVTAINGSFVVTATDGDTVLHTFPTATAVTGGYTVTLPFSLVDKDRKFTINWLFQYNEGTAKTYTAKTYVEVVTPYVTVEEIRTALGTMPTMTDDAVKRVERRIRGVIDNYTGQSFGLYFGKKRVQARGDEDLLLPQRLLSIVSVEGAVWNDLSRYATRGNGWYLSNATPLYADGSYVSTGVISWPGTTGRRILWKDNVWYTIDGEWGYEDVPYNVKEAALILIEDNVCPDSEYRDRYIDSVKTADYQYMYDPNAFRGTGSVIADQLLAPYIRPTLAVI